MPKRKRPNQTGGSLQDGAEPNRWRDKIKKTTKGKKNDNSSAVAASTPPSKEYLAEGSEHIYRTHTCPICRRCFKMRSHLQEHLHLHFPDPNLQCPTCKRHFTSKSKLRIHRLREAGEKLHRCHLCDYSAVEKNAIRRHLASMHADAEGDDGNSLSFLCPSCGLNFSQSRALKTHMKSHNTADNKPLACFHQGCCFQSSLRKDLIRHAAEVHGITAVECRHHTCSAIFQSDTDMESHYRTHLAYHCSECDFSCSNKSVFLQHRRLGHAGNEKLCCDFCSFITFNPVEFERHVGHLHASEKTHRCPQCSYVTAHKRGLVRHMLMHSGEKPHKCSLCDFRCRDESYLSKHMLTHSEDKNYMCAECGYVTKWKHYLNVHMRKHAGDLRYSCDQCPYRCHRMDQLNSHKLRHQAKSLICEICAYACKRKYELRNHMMAKHSGEQKQPVVFKCKYCSYTSCYRQALQNHENCKHTKLKEFRCALCSYSSFSSISFFLHKRKTHGYVPGDKAWLENYAAKEKEKNSTELSQDFYLKKSTGHKQFEQSNSELFDNQIQQSASSSLDSTKKGVTGSQLEDSVDIVDVSQEVVNEGPEEYCTLVLTTLSSGTSLQNEEEKAPNTQIDIPNDEPLAQEKGDFSTDESSIGDEDAAVPECEHSDLEDSYEAQNDRSQSVEDQTETSEVENKGETISPTFPLEQNQSLQSAKATKKHNKDQAESMLLEGRVQMLVLPPEDVFRCDKCSFVASKETALRQHCQASHSTMKGNQCETCGKQFQQKRGLDNHLKKCPTLPRKTKIFIGTSNTCQTTDQSLSQVEGSEQLNGRMDPEEISSQNTSTSEKPSKILRNEPQDETASSKKQKASSFTKKDGKFECNQCSFASVRLTTIERHLSTCRKSSKKSHFISEVDDVGEKDMEEVNDHEKKFSKKVFRCSSCGFRCNQKRALESHEKKGCMKPGEVQCTICSFIAKSNTSLSRHSLYVHKKDKFKRLHCELCPFSCKQERRMVQHVALKHKGTRPHQCRFCSFSTTRRYRLEEHESLHTGVGRHTCNLCDKSFGAVTKLRQHKIRIHEKQPTQFCPLCDFSGYTLDDVRRHNVRCHTGELQHVCTHCEARFSSEVALRNHCKRVHQLQACFSCKQCDYTCSSDVTLKVHQQNKHPQVKCSTCQELFDTKESLANHQRTHLAHQCHLCVFAAKTKQLLAQHLLSEHENGSPEEKPLKCHACQFACRHQLVLELHLRSHGSRRLYKCTDCKYSTRNKQKITWHIRIHTGEKPYSCEQCSYSCADPSRLKLHMRVHQEEKKYLCPECGYKCKWATQLKYHMTKHTGEKPYVCNKCDYRTNRVDALRAHQDTQHSDLRPYVCEKCGKAFKTSFILKTHQRQHSDGRPYTCGLCEKAFRWPAGLRHHYLSHTQQTPFSCRHCSYTAKQKFQVVKHLRRHHPEVSAEQGVVRNSQSGSLTLKEALQGTLGGEAVEGKEREQNGANEEKEETSGSKAKSVDR